MHNWDMEAKIGKRIAKTKLASVHKRAVLPGSQARRQVCSAPGSLDTSFDLTRRDFLT